jgi:hypothetical protein
MTQFSAFAVHRADAPHAPQAPQSMNCEETIPMSQSGTVHGQDRGYDQTCYPSTHTPPDRTSTAAWDRIDAQGIPPQAMQPGSQDPYAFYRAFQDTNANPGGELGELTQDYDGYTGLTGGIGVRNLNANESQQQTRARAVSDHQAVRLANRSNGAPLATIIEQGSYSTLNSRGSLLSVGRFPSIRTAGVPSPGRTSQRSLDENTLLRILEDDPQEQVPTAAAAEAHAKAMLQDQGRSHLVFDPIPPITRDSGESSQGTLSQISGPGNDPDDWRLKGFLRGVLHNVRAASRSRSPPSSMRHVSTIKVRPDWPSDTSPPGQLLDYSHPRHDGTSSPAPRAATSTPIARSQVTNGKISSPNSHTPAAIYPPLLESSLPLLETSSAFGHVPYLLPPSTATCSRERSASVRLVPPEPRDVAQAVATAGAPTRPNQYNGNNSAQYFFDRDLAFNHSAASLKKNEVAKETSRNASVCSTMSTSYSGTVLGVDMDLQFQTPQAVRRSSSPMPV